MALEFPQTTAGATKKGWQLENTIDLGIKGAVVGAGVYFYGTWMPFVVSALDNTLHAVVVGGTLLGIGYVVMDPKIRNLVRASYQIGIRKLTGFVVERDPIGIMKNYIETLKTRQGEMMTQMQKLKGEMRKLKDTIDEIKTNAELDAKRAQKAQEIGNRGAAGLSANKVGRAKSNLEQLVPLHAKMEKLHTFLTKMYESIGFMIEDISDEVMTRERLYTSIKAGSNAVSSAAAVMNGDKDSRAMFEMATEAVKDDVANRVGYMEQFIQESTNFINGVDIDNAVFEDKGLEMIEQFDKGGLDWLFTKVGEGPAAQPVLVANQPGVINIAPQGQPQQLSKHSNFFD